MTQYCSEDTGTELLRRHQGEECLGVLRVFCAWCFCYFFFSPLLPPPQFTQEKSINVVFVLRLMLLLYLQDSFGT